METSPCHNSVAGHRIATNPCTCHDSTAVVPCIKFCSDHCIRIEIRVKRNFHQIWIAIEKSLVKRGPVQETLTLFVLNFICETLKYICILFHFLTLRWNRSSTASLLAWKDLFILHGQYHGSWWPGSLRRQGISCYGILTMYSLNIPVSAPEGLTHWGRDKMDAISQTTFSNQFSWMKMYEYRFKFHWSLFLRVQLTIFQHWFR